MHTSTTSTVPLEPWSAAQLAEATQGSWYLDKAPQGEIKRILTDSRHAELGDAFLALKGERNERSENRFNKARSAGNGGNSYNKDRSDNRGNTFNSNRSDNRYGQQNRNNRVEGRYNPNERLETGDRQEREQPEKKKPFVVNKGFKKF